MNQTPNRISPAALKSLLEAGGTTLVDVRSPAEFRAGHIPGAVSLPVDELASTDPVAANSGIPDDRDAPLVLTCLSGLRAERAAQLLAGHGYRNLAVLDGGTEGWRTAALPMQRCGGAIAIERQVQIAIGTLLVLKVGFGFAFHEMFFAFAALIGAGLIVAGVTRWCGLAQLIARMPWNRGRHCGERIPV